MAFLPPALDLRCPGQRFVFWQCPWTAVPLGLLVGSSRRAEPGWRVPGARMCLQAQGSGLGLRPKWESEAPFAVRQVCSARGSFCSSANWV